LMHSQRVRLRKVLSVVFDFQLISRGLTLAFDKNTYEYIT
jgi:hypothetical protein